METLIIFLLFATSSVGATHIFVDGEIAQPLRNFLIYISKFVVSLLEIEQLKRLPEKVEYMVKCNMCSGFWIGLICGYFTMAQVIYICPAFIVVILCGFTTSFLANLAQWYFLYLGSE